jgi:Flp pilus assembly protein CpaB
VSRHRRRALACAALAAVLAVAALADLGAGSAAPAPVLVPRIIVRSPLAAGVRVTAAALAVTRVPARLADPHQLSDPRQAIGRRVAVPLPAGSPLMDAELVEPASGGPARDVAIRLDDTAGVPAGDLTGVHADIYLVRPGRAGRAVRVLTDVLVVSAGRTDQGAAATLRLPPAAVAVALEAEARGALALVVRPPTPGAP